MKKRVLLSVCIFFIGATVVLEAQSFLDCSFNRGSWINKTPMPESRENMAASVIGGKIYVTCGRKSWDLGSGMGFESEYKHTLFCYDPIEDSWDTTRTPIPVTRAFLSGQTVVNGNWYLVGGMRFEEASPDTWVSTPLARVDVYDPQTDSWEQKANLPEPVGFAGICSLDGKIYVTGGAKTLESDLHIHKWAYMYDPELDEWKAKADMTTARATHVSLSFNGKIYVFGGDPTGKAAEVYNPELDEWTKIASAPYYTDLAGGCVLNNEIYLFGGTRAGAQNLIVSSLILKYNPEDDLWATYGLLPDAMQAHTVCAVGEKVYLIGGTRKSDPWVSNDAVSEFELSKLMLEEISPATVNKEDSISMDLSQHFSHQLGEPISFTVCISDDGVLSKSMEGPMMKLKGLEAGSATVYIRAESGTDEFGTQFSVEVTPAVSVPGLEEVSGGINIYPNPAGNHLTVDLQKEGIHAYLIYSASGQQVLEGILPGSSHTIDLSLLDKGMYFIKVSSPELAVTRKFLKIW